MSKDDEPMRSGVFVVAIFLVTALVNGLLALGFIELLEALGWWGESR